MPALMWLFILSPIDLLLLNPLDSLHVTSQKLNPDFERHMEELHRKLQEGRAVVVYFDAIERRSLPSATDLRSRFPDIPLQRFEDGFAMGRPFP